MQSTKETDEYTELLKSKKNNGDMADNAHSEQAYDLVESQQHASDSKLGSEFANPEEQLANLKHLVTVLVPALNEERGIGQVIDTLRDSGYENLLVIDGYSEDATVRVARSKKVPVIMQHGPGKAGAIKTALQYVATPYILLIDADTTYNPADIERFLQHMRHFDEIIGARKGQSGNITILNRLGNWVINKAFKVLFSTPITDVCSGMYLLKTSFAKEMDIHTTSFDVEVEIAAQAASRGRITQVPIRYGKRVGKTKLNPLKDGVKIIRTLFWMAHYHNPVMLYSFLVALAGVPAIGILGYTAIQEFVFRQWHPGDALFGTMLLLLASQAGAVGMMSLLFKRMEARVKEFIRPAL